MGRQLIAMGMGMGIMPWRKCWLCLRVVGQVWLLVIHRVVTGITLVAFLVLAIQ